MRINKRCTCGQLHTILPQNAREWVDDSKLLGHFFECHCHSTLFITNTTKACKKCETVFDIAKEGAKVIIAKMEHVFCQSCLDRENDLFIGL